MKIAKIATLLGKTNESLEAVFCLAEHGHSIASRAGLNR